jgi:hypothetical protein
MLKAGIENVQALPISVYEYAQHIFSFRQTTKVVRRCLGTADGETLRLVCLLCVAREPD